jgi:hypothetical protein
VAIRAGALPDAGDRVVVLVRLVARGGSSGVSLTRKTAHVWTLAKPARDPVRGLPGSLRGYRSRGTCGMRHPASPGPRRARVGDQGWVDARGVEAGWKEPDTEEERVAEGAGRGGIGGISLGGIIVIVGIVLMIFWSFWISLIIALVGLIAFGGFARGKWY